MGGTPTSRVTRYSSLGEEAVVTIYGLKPRFQALLRPLAGALYRAGPTANQVTLFACIVSVALGALLLIALVITILGFFGGLVMSAIKRDRGVKDWGTLIEGHGGVLDRLDSVCFSAPIFFHVVRYWWTP
ncbi:MAG TPA: phosphatidate cytidylyltransferase [Burkholderiales bacterium]|nr:phosphatidate cytidylyltransferase [Burkholderiales bacterium]